ncbi:hypothetical protein [Mycolicibacterium fortuitum]|uniref:hypothetical protein n=1 Tax=Mycolicibacterium fortuitum TaxID=1766 RepID=UPI0007EACAF7|nr:hypothetical protein [Mycolicibacterium fortuitum]
MRRPGVVVAETTKKADQLREALGLRDWVILSPRTAHVSMRGVECEPRCVTDDPACLTPMVRLAVETSAAAWRRPVRFYAINSVADAAAAPGQPTS